MTLRCALVLLLLCASQGLAVPTTSAPPSPTATPTPTPTPAPSPSASPEPKGSDKGLDDEEALLAMAIVVMLVIVVGVGVGLFFWWKGDSGSSGFLEWFNDVVGVWYRFFFKVLEACLPLRIIGLLCYISSALMVLLAITGAASGDGGLLCGALFCFFIFIALTSEKENVRKLQFGLYSFRGFILAVGVFWIISVIAMPAKYFVKGEDNAAIFMLFVLAWVLGMKSIASLMQLRLETGVPLGGSSGGSTGTGGGYETVEE